MIVNIVLYLLVLHNLVYLLEIVIILMLFVLLNNLELEILLIVDFGYGVKVNLLYKAVMI